MCTINVVLSNTERRSSQLILLMKCVLIALICSKLAWPSILQSSYFNYSHPTAPVNKYHWLHLPQVMHVAEFDKAVCGVCWWWIHICACKLVKVDHDSKVEGAMKSNQPTSPVQTWKARSWIISHGYEVNIDL